MYEPFNDSFFQKLHMVKFEWITTPPPFKWEVQDGIQVPEPGFQEERYNFVKNLTAAGVTNMRFYAPWPSVEIGTLEKDGYNVVKYFISQESAQIFADFISDLCNKNGYTVKSVTITEVDNPFINSTRITPIQ